MEKLKLLNSVLIAANLLLCTVFCQAQRQQDTIKVVLLASDTAHNSNRDYSLSYWVFGYPVREKHNTDEGILDPYHEFGYVSKDYWVHRFYLDDKKQPLKPTVIVWQSVSEK